MDPNDWTLTGNAGTDPATNFLGTTDNEPLIIKTNGTESLRVNATGSVNFAGDVGIAGHLGIGPTNSYLYVYGPLATPNVETAELLGLQRQAVGGVKNGNSAGLFLGAFEPGINGRSRLDIKVAGTPGDSNGWGGIPDVTVMTLHGDGSVGIGTSNPLPSNVLEVRSTDNRAAVSGYSNPGQGVYGFSNGGTGVRGDSVSETGVGVFGNCHDGIGVSGSGGTIGVSGGSTSGIAVQGTVFGDQSAVVGISGNQTFNGIGDGVFGISYRGSGVEGQSTNGSGVKGYSVNSWCGEFQSTLSPTARGVYISVPAGQPGLQVASGTKSAVVATSQGTRALHTEESTAVWFTDYGFGHLQAGRTVVTIDTLFAETVNLSEPYHVFVQLNDADAEGVAVVNKTASSFEVVELRNGHSNAEFSYRLVAKRRGYETHRLEQAPWADDDPNLYPEKRSAWEAQQRLRRPEIPQVEVPPRPPEMPR